MATQTSADRRETRGVLSILIWTIAWAGSLALATFSNKLFGDSPTLGWILIGLNVVIGIGWIIAHSSYLRRVDELQRKIMTEALAVGLGVGVVGGLAYAAASNLGLLDLDFGLAVFPVLAGVSYAIASIAGNVRYR